METLLSLVFFNLKWSNHKVLLVADLDVNITASATSFVYHDSRSPSLFACLVGLRQAREFYTPLSLNLTRISGFCHKMYIPESCTKSTSLLSNSASKVQCNFANARRSSMYARLNVK